MKCLNCGKEHNNKSYCSKKCNISYRNKNRIVSFETKQKISISLKNKKPKNIKNCLCCGKEHNNRHFCSHNCSASYNNKFREITDETRMKLSKINKGKIGFKHNDETKRILSEKLRNYYLQNPEKHNWRRCDKMISKPCELFKEILKIKNIFFVEELKPLNDYNYSIDVALPEYKIAFEINGNQHYKRGISELKLNEYYQNRHDLIVNGGWNLIELFYKTVYDKNISSLVDNILIEKNFEYNIETKKYFIDSINKKLLCKKCSKEKCECEVIKENKKLERKKTQDAKIILKIEQKNQKIKNKETREQTKYNICKCGKLKLKDSIRCKDCNKDKRSDRKVERPSYDILIDEINHFGYLALSRKYGVSDNSIRKWKKYYEKNVSMM